MVTNVVAAWLIASQSEMRRKIGFYCFLTGKYPLGNLGMAHSGVGNGGFANLPRRTEHSRRQKKRRRQRLAMENSDILISRLE